MRSIHSVSGIIIAIFISLIAMTGAYLSIIPLLDQLSVAPNPGLSVADVASITVEKLPEVERIERKPSGEILVHAFTDNGMTTSTLNQQTLQLTPHIAASELNQFFTELHRSMFLGDLGRAITGLSAFALILISYSGLFVLAKRMGGWSNILRAAKGSKSQKLHIDIARFTLIGFSFSALTGLYMSLASFGFIASSTDNIMAFPDNVAQGEKMPLAQMQALINIPISQLRELTFPYPDDPQDVFTIKTDQGEGFIDQVTGEIIAFQPSDLSSKIYETIYLLHTGKGGMLASILALILGISALAIPVLSLTGIIIWWKRRRQSSANFENSKLIYADAAILVGSESRSTWGFASTLHNALVKEGKNVHTSSMNEVTQAHLNTENIFILTSTYGDGTAPKTADQFIKKLESLEIKQTSKFAVLGFGDKQFSNFCAFAQSVELGLKRKQTTLFHPLTKINQQCPQAFKDWGRQIGQKMNCDLDLEHLIERPKTRRIALSKIVCRSQETENQTAILRFEISQNRFGMKRNLLDFKAGDLIAFIPPKSDIPRYYSIASCSEDGFIEICVKRHKFGLCSNYLLNLNEGDEIDHFIKTNDSFKPADNANALVMIGAGTGIAPLAGFARENAKHRPTYLFWGGRNPRIDFIYKDTLLDLTRQRKLSKSYFAFSRFADRYYVQDRLNSEAELLKSLINDGAQIMVCGGAEMAMSVRDTIDGIASHIGESTNSLQQQKRYLEDVY